MHIFYFIPHFFRGIIKYFIVYFAVTPIFLYVRIFKLMIFNFKV